MRYKWIKRTPMKFLQTILKSIFFRKAFALAIVVSSQKNKALSFVNKADHKINRGGNTKIFEVIKDKINITFRMLKYYFKGEYKNISLNTLLKILAGIIYFVFLIDLIPDFLPVVGLTDDVVVLTWVINSIGGELRKFEIWEAQKEIDKMDIQFA
jgi:uncharacterized membrane protein YkvA (DUF1232 family)